MTANQLLNELSREIKDLNRELNDLRTPEWRKLFLLNRLRVVGERLERLLKEMKEVVK